MMITLFYECKTYNPSVLIEWIDRNNWNPWEVLIWAVAHLGHSPKEEKIEKKAIH